MLTIMAATIEVASPIVIWVVQENSPHLRAHSACPSDRAVLRIPRALVQNNWVLELTIREPVAPER
jgi:hypothetical protein